MERKTDLQNISNAERHNFDSGLKVFTKEVYFYNKLENLFSFTGKTITDEYSVIISLLQLCHHNLIFSFLNLLRGHFKEPGIISRNSIEAVGQATIIKENIDVYSRVWCKGENERNKKDVEEFKKIFKRDKFRKCKYKKELKNYYRIFSSFSHPNITADMHRLKREKDKLLFGYFDTEVDNVDAWMIRYLNYTILAYITILEEFTDILDDSVSISKKNITEFKREHRLYLETRRSFLSQLGKYDN